MQISLAGIFAILKLKPEMEYRFHHARKWRFDYAFPEKKIAFEYEGIFCKKSRHTTLSGFNGDCEKYNTAQEMGWKVYRITAIMLSSKQAFDLIERVLKGKK